MEMSVPSCFSYITTLNVYDMIDFDNMVFVFNVANYLLPDHNGKLL